MQVTFQPTYVLPEVRAGKAPLFRSFHVRNVRGTERDWLRISALVNGLRMRGKVVRNLPVGDSASAMQLEEGVIREMLLPQQLQPGRQSGRLLMHDSQGEADLPFQFDVLDARFIPTDFARSSYLAAYVQDDDALRGFAAEALKQDTGASPVTAARLLYEALQAKELQYQPPVATKYTDCEQVSSLAYVLRKGGSCAELSLLFASLLWVRGLSPVLLLFRDHLAVGCFSADYLPDYETTSDAEMVWQAIHSKKLTLFEATGVCRHRQTSFEGAVRGIQSRLQDEDAWRLIHVKQILRGGTVTTLPPAAETTAACGNCGYPLTQTSLDQKNLACPACGEIVKSARDEPPAPAMPSNALYTKEQGYAVLRQLRDTAAQEVQIAPSYLGSAVREIAPYALKQSKASHIFLPDSLVSIGDYAFSRCQNLKSIKLHEGLKQVKAGAFSGSGLTAVRIPGTVARIERLAFAYCEQLESATIEEGVEVIGERAFQGCPGLRSVNIPASVRRIERNAFDSSCAVYLASEETQLMR